MKKIFLLAVGGTISYLAGSSEKKKGAAILEEAKIDESLGIDVVVRDVLHTSSSNMSVYDLAKIAKEVFRSIDDGADGIVISQGTDTIEETAFFMEMVVPNVVPVIVTGAMRHTGLLEADGGENLRCAVIAAASDKLKKIGSMVVFDGQVLPSYFVRKTNTQSLDTFKSQFGIIGYFSEEKLRVVFNPVKPGFDYKFGKSILEKELKDVFVQSVNIGDDGRILKFAKSEDYSGIVLDGLGGGHCTTKMAEMLKKIALEIPCVMSSRTGSGEVQISTYSGYPGSETELRKIGVIYSGILDARKSRILLILMLSNGMKLSEIQAEFPKYAILGA